MLITKSDYLLFKQCQKSFWLKKNKSETIKIEDESILEKGKEVTEKARELFPGGKTILYHHDKQKMIDKTREYIEKGEKIIYEAAFEYEGCFVMCDVLKKDSENDTWDLYEVKSSTKVKERHIDDLSFQSYIVKNNVNLNHAFITYINNLYIREEELELKKLFIHQDETDQTSEKEEEIRSDIYQMKLLLTKEEPKVDIGEYCNKYKNETFECSAKKHCWSHIPEVSVFNLSRIGKKAFELYKEGILSLEDIPEDYKLSKNQKFQVNANNKKEEKFDDEDLRLFFEDWVDPLYFIDFETYQQAIPLYKGIKPYQQIPFQYSLHILKEKKLEHYEFLAEEGKDPRRKFALRLVKDIPRSAKSIAFNMSFEKMVIKSLAEAFNDLREHLMDIHDNMVDLMTPFQKNWIYKNEMKGKYSIKYVLPALFPNEQELDYQKLTIQNGTMAMNTFRMLHTKTKKEKEKLRKALLEYCKLDTLAMVRIYEYIVEKLKSN